MTSTDPTTPMTEYPEIDELLRELDENGVLLLTLNRPERNNGWTFALEDAYFGTLIAAANDRAVRAIVVTGAGKSVCPGLDMQLLEESAKQGSPGADVGDGRTSRLRRGCRELSGQAATGVGGA